MNIESILCEQTEIKLNLTSAGEQRLFLVASIRSPLDAVTSAWDSYIEIGKVLRERQLEIVHERILGSLSVELLVMAARHHALQTWGIPPDNPVTYIQGHPPWGDGLAGVIIQAISRNSVDDVWTITDGRRPCGQGWRHNGSVYLVLQSISSKHENSKDSENRTLQVGRMLDRAARILHENDSSYGDVVRTWFYLSQILEWYPAFNQVRNEKYREFNIMPQPGSSKLLLPASTGIGADSPLGGAATMDLIAITGENGARPSIKQLTNTAQLDAFRYGSAFSRGALIQEPDVSIIEVSGTAAIDQQGKSQFVKDINGQIHCTFDKIEELIGQEGAGLKDLAAATVFVKRAEHAEIFWDIVEARGLGDFPAVCVVADVCRDELLFEIDAEAAFVPSGKREEYGNE
jgi:enamine deaminase RidA (YjgF/YER057c/UK114 family)